MPPENNDLLVKLQEESNGLLLQIRTKYEEMEKSRITKGDFDTFVGNVKGRLDEVDKTIAALKVPPMPIPGQGTKDTDAEFAVKTFDKCLRKGRASLSPEEQKVMTVADPTTGGYFAIPEFTAELIKGIVEYSPIRSVARVVQTSARSKQWPKKTTSAAAAWVAEIGTRAETTNPAFGLEEIPVHEMYAMAKVSRQDIEDAKFDLLGFLREEFSEQFGVTEGTAFVSGDAVGKPQGLLVNPSITGYTGTGTSSKIDADDLKRVLYTLKDAYAKQATWLWKRSSTLAISLLKDATAGYYVWQPGLQLGSPANVLGLPYVECIDMPAEGSSAKAVMVGDFRRGYIIVDRLDIEVMDDPYSSKSTGCVEFSARKRVGGQVVLAEAIKLLTLKA
jgi:HK97 family phage major capsid protein